MIEMLEGVPGSGKSYHAISERFLSWVRSNRRIYVYVDGIFLDRLSQFEGISIETLTQQITVWKTPDEVRTALLTVEHGSAVLIDESQTVFRSKEKVAPELLRRLETHRHDGIDIVLMCQQYGQMTLGVVRLVEVTTKFRRLDRFGFKNRYQAQVRGNPEETETIRMFTGRYDPRKYAYYSSYSNAAIRETARGGSILKSPTLIMGLIGLVVAVGWFSFGGWLSGAKPAQAMTRSTLPPPPPLPVLQSAPGESIHPQGEGAIVYPLEIQGGMTVFKNGSERWLWVTGDGRLLDEDEIAAESGGSVRTRMLRGVKVISGSGVHYGGRPTERVEVAQKYVPYEPEANLNVTGPMPEMYDSGRPNPFKTPPDLR